MATTYFVVTALDARAASYEQMPLPLPARRVRRLRGQGREAERV